MPLPRGRAARTSSTPAAATVCAPGDGAVTQTIEAHEMIWNFVRGHQLWSTEGRQLDPR
jgi:hypothetical protein